MTQMWMMDDRHTPSRPSHFAVLVVALALLALPVLYVGSYFALVERDPRATFVFADDTVEYYDAQYAMGGEAAQTLFRAMYLVDVWLRPRYWQYPIYSDPREI